MSDAEAASQKDMVAPQVLLDIWFSFHIVGGHFLIPVLLVTFLLSKAKRDATLINFGITLSLSSVFNCVLLYAHEYIGPEPNKKLCIFQAALFGASAPMWSVAALALILQVRSRVALKPIRWLPAMVMAPYLFFLIFAVVVLVAGSRRPDTVTRARRKLYCSIESPIISMVSICFTSAVSCVAICLATAMSYQLYKFLRQVRRARRPQIRVIPLATRLVIFMFYLFCALVTSLWSLKDHNTYIRDIYTSTFGVAYFLVFGTQRDVLKAWCFWRKYPVASNTGTMETGAHTAEDIVIPPNYLFSGSVASLSDIETSHETLPTFPPLSIPITHYVTKNTDVIVTTTRTQA